MPPSSPPSSSTSRFFRSTSRVITLSIVLRLVLIVYGIYHDAHSPLKYTDIDYFVFTDAARFVHRDQSPYLRETYRYTPLLAWLLLPNAWRGWEAWGKVVFALGDVAAGWIMILILRARGMNRERSLKYSSIWLLNPMVAVISTRGNAEGLLGFMTSLLILLVQRGQPLQAGLLLGFSVHFKIYPFIYTPTILFALDMHYDRLVFPPSSKVKTYGEEHRSSTPTAGLLSYLHQSRILFCLGAAIGFLSSTIWMYNLYGQEFLQHSYLHHVSRLDHRHNFSPYHLTLYLSSSLPKQALSISSLAFIPQLVLVGLVIPLALYGRDLATTMFAQTFAFVAFNKVCTSQYFMWYISFLPLYLPTSPFLQSPTKGVVALASWIISQAAWLYYGYRLEILGENVFYPQLWGAGMAFFAVNVGILGCVLSGR